MDNFMRFDMSQVKQAIADNNAAKVSAPVVAWETMFNRMVARSKAIMAERDTLALITGKPMGNPTEYTDNVVCVDFKARKRIG